MVSKAGLEQTNNHYNEFAISKTSSREVIKHAGEPVNIPFGLGELYNFFIRQYNNDCNRIGQIYLSEVPVSVFDRTKGMFCFFILICLGFVPGFSFIVFVIGVYVFINHFRKIHIVKRNRKLVANPFQRMIYFENLTSINMYLNWSLINECQDLVLNYLSHNDFEQIKLLYNECKIERNATIMLYRNEFRHYESSILNSVCFFMYVFFPIFFTSGFGTYFTYLILDFHLG